MTDGKSLLIMSLMSFPSLSPCSTCSRRSNFNRWALYSLLIALRLNLFTSGDWYEYRRDHRWTKCSLQSVDAACGIVLQSEVCKPIIDIVLLYWDIFDAIDSLNDVYQDRCHVTWLGLGTKTNTLLGLDAKSWCHATKRFKGVFKMHYFTVRRSSESLYIIF